MRDDLMFDVAVVGAGPAGLAFTRSLAGTGLSVALIEGQGQAALRDPAFDGREIALTHNSIRLLKSLGAWDRVPAEEISDLREARVLGSLWPDRFHVLRKRVDRCACGRDLAVCGSDGCHFGLLRHRRASK